MDFKDYTDVTEDINLLRKDKRHLLSKITGQSFICIRVPPLSYINSGRVFNVRRELAAGRQIAVRFSGECEIKGSAPQAGAASRPTPEINLSKEAQLAGGGSITQHQIKHVQTLTSDGRRGSDRAAGVSVSDLISDIGADNIKSRKIGDQSTTMEISLIATSPTPMFSEGRGEVATFRRSLCTVRPLFDAVEGQRSQDLDIACSDLTSLKCIAS
ncbi:hypothetical protein EVAR_53248_1 [Eumeta japonica]|uniref:Uncharacterized protein n=1 Tax=Eumeta variegata TaxID=151549 RepID=A0A4C1XDR2_EUMVA|nr:hypothetical protein EVAR_53248_1 [Eumeta japonica]